MRVLLEGQPAAGVGVKDMILALIARIGVSGGVGYAIEYAGGAIANLSMEARMTLCNMSIEAGSRVGLVAPDETTFAWLAGRPMAPAGADWEAAMAYWKTLPTDPDAVFDREVSLNVGALAPRVTWGTTPEDNLPIDGVVPDPDREPDPDRRARMQRSLRYMGLKPGARLNEVPIDRVFIGSCTNGRLEDLRQAAAILVGRRVAPNVAAIVVPGSATVRLQAEAEGLDRVFRAAGFEWRDSGCSMCVAMNDDRLQSGERCASTSNRNFEGRQGPNGRTHLMSPAMAAAAAISGKLTDVRALESRRSMA
jgi:3-isopropylmalate/(R)-2-methylmalate dehydratase large subunit